METIKRKMNKSICTMAKTRFRMNRSKKRLLDQSRRISPLG
jgi:hypothetical protein